MRLWRKQPPRIEEEAHEIPTLALSEALERLPNHRPPRVLDLGPACGRNVDFFSQLGCRLEIFDLRSSINDGSRSEAQRSSRVRGAIEAFLVRSSPPTEPPVQGPRPEHGYDLILGWDLLDYIEEREIAELFASLAPRCHRGTLLLIFVSYRSPIPSRPRRYQIRDASALAFEEAGSGSRTSPGFKEAKLRKLLPGFEVASCFLMRHGVQEYLFVVG